MVSTDFMKREVFAQMVSLYYVARDQQFVLDDGTTTTLAELVPKTFQHIKEMEDAFTRSAQTGKFPNSGAGSRVRKTARGESVHGAGVTAGDERARNLRRQGQESFGDGQKAPMAGRVSGGNNLADSTTPTGFFSKLGETFDNLLANPIGTFKEMGLGWMTLEQLADSVKSKAVRAYADVMVAMQQMSKTRIAEAA